MLKHVGTATEKEDLIQPVILQKINLGHESKKINEKGLKS